MFYMAREKYNLISELNKKSKEMEETSKLGLVGQGDFYGANNIMRLAMNLKHQAQHLTIDNPEFPFLYDGKENLMGEYSSFYEKTKKEYKVMHIIKKYEELLKGKCKIALYFLYCKDDDSWKLIERKEVENLTENFGFEYNNEYLDNAEIGEVIPKDTVLYTSTSYDENMNVSVGVNGRILYAAHPAVQDDAIIVSESFAKRMITNQIVSRTISINDNYILLNLYGDKDNYQGIPNIGQSINNGILCATRSMKETRMFSDLRDSSLSVINLNVDNVYYADGKVVDINVYCNNPNIKKNKVNSILLEYYQDARWFYSEVYRTCKGIIKSKAKHIDIEINRWMRRAMDYLDTEAHWAFNDNIFSNLMVEILIQKKVAIGRGRKIVGRAGNKTVVSSIWPDDEMPYLTTECYRDQYGVVHPKGKREKIELITNPLAIINRTIPMVLFESSITFITDKARKHMAEMDNIKEQSEFMFDIIDILNFKQGKEIRDLYATLSDREKKEFIQSAIKDGIYIRWEAFDEEINLRDNIIKIYEKYSDIMKPYEIFIPKPKWGRDIHIGSDYIGYQYIMMLKQNGERGFSARAAGSINDESLPEKSNNNKTGRFWASDNAVKFGEYELSNFMIVTSPKCNFLGTPMQ